MNAGTGKELSIKELTEIVAKVVGFEGEIVWDKTKPMVHHESCWMFRKLSL